MTRRRTQSSGVEAACFECDAPSDHAHHVVPRSLGGARTVPLCGVCHGRAHGNDGRSATTRALTKAALAAKRSRGERIGSVPYGYQVANDGRTLEPRADEAVAVALVRELRAEGMALRAIATRLEAAGCVPRGGGRWHPDTVARIAAVAA